MGKLEKMKKMHIHKDFHGAFSYGLKYLKENYGEEMLKAYLIQVARNVYSPLIEQIKKEGLSAMEDHQRKIFTTEEADFELKHEGDKLVLKVKVCPALRHMKEKRYPVFEKFCEHDRIVTGIICQDAGYGCSVDYDQDKCSCIQRFWKKR